MDGAEFLRDVVRSAEAIGPLTRSEDVFRAAMDAWRAGDADSFQRLLGELEIIDRCELVCGWLCSKDCVLECLELCGPPPQEVPAIREFAEVVARITGDEELVERLAEAVEERDAQAFNALVDELKIRPFCHLLCHWVCVVRCRLTCGLVCPPPPPIRLHLEDELVRAGQALKTLAANQEAIGLVEKGLLSNDCELVRSGITAAGIPQHCAIICEWLCSWRCIWICIDFCRPFLSEVAEASLGEAFAFAQAMTELSSNTGAMVRLAEAVEARNAEAFAELVKELRLERFCIQLCHWLCYLSCGWFCRCVCPDPRWNPLFTHVGNFAIYANIDYTGTGRTSVGLTGYSTLYYDGGPDFGFTSCLELRGFCPVTWPYPGGTLMRYRFLYEYPSGNRVAITGNLVCAVTVGTRYITWPDPTGSFYTSVAQTIRVAGSGATPGVPPPPPLGPPPPSVPDHIIVPDPNGWIEVDPLTIDGGFQGPLVGFETSQAFPGGPIPLQPGSISQTVAGSVAGQAPVAADQPNGMVAAIIFEATRVTTPPASPPDFTNALPKIHINNWGSLQLLELLQFVEGDEQDCTPLSTDLDIQYTADHELMAAWSVNVTSAATFSHNPFPSDALASDPPPSAMTKSARGGYGTHHEDITSWPSCSYIVHLYTRRRLTTGIVDDTTVEVIKTFCK